MKWAGLVGLIGSGKSTAGGLFRERGAVTIDVDQLNRDLQQPGQEVHGLIVDHFGDEILASDGTIDRAVLGGIVFADRAKLAELTGLVAAISEEELVRRARVHEGTDTVVLVEAALIVGRMYGLEAIVVVDVDPVVALDRLVRHRGMTPDDARARMAAQTPRAERLAAADLVIDNSGDLAHLAAEVDRALAWIATHTPDAHPRVERRS